MHDLASAWSTGHSRCCFRLGKPWQKRCCTECRRVLRAYSTQFLFLLQHPSNRMHQQRQMHIGTLYIMKVNAGDSSFDFQDNSGTRYNLPLYSYTWTKGDTMDNFATNYLSSTFGGTTYALNIQGAAVFKFYQSSTAPTVFVYIPFTSTGSDSNLNVVDLTQTSKISNSLSHYDGNGALSAFNFFDTTNYNQWFVQNIGTEYVLVSRYIYKINSVANMVSTTS